MTLWVVGVLLVALIAVAAIAALIFRQKMQVDRQKLQMALYDRRAAAVLALTNAVERVGEPISVDEFAAPGMAPPFANSYPERPFEPRKEPGLPPEVVIAFRYLFDDSVVEAVEKIHRLSIEADEGDRRAEKRLPHAFSVLVEKIERDMKVSAR